MKQDRPIWHSFNVKILVSCVTAFVSFSLAEALPSETPQEARKAQASSGKTIEQVLLKTNRVLSNFEKHPDDFQGLELLAFAENQPQSGHAFARLITKSRLPHEDIIIGFAKGIPPGVSSNLVTEVFTHELFSLVESKVFNQYLREYFLNRNRHLVRVKIETTAAQRRLLIRHLRRQVKASIRTFLSERYQTAETLAESSRPLMYNGLQNNCIQLLFEFLKMSGVRWKGLGTSNERALPIFPSDIGKFSYEVGLTRDVPEVYRSGRLIAKEHRLLTHASGVENLKLDRLREISPGLTNYELIMLNALYQDFAIRDLIGSELRRRNISGSFSTAGFFLR
ncbi:MAG TPA: hypothetical protein VM432_12490 [Bdellovibrionales bacterium]|nr:hypothetical protein [Bdellovibrionales bacterium]